MDEGGWSGCLDDGPGKKLTEVPASRFAARIPGGFAAAGLEESIREELIEFAV
jgi:hypothetical protein